MKKLASCTNYGGFVYFSVISVPAEFIHTVYISRHMMKRMSWSRNFFTLKMNPPAEWTFYN